MYKYKFLQVAQLPQEHLPFLQNLMNFLITKYLKHELDGVNVALVASIIGDIKIYQCHMIKRQWRCYLQWRGSLSTFITELLFLSKFGHRSPSVTRDNEICQSTQRNPFNNVYLLSKFDVPNLRT